MSRPPRRGAVLGWSMAGLVAITWVRAAWLRTLAVDRTGNPWSWGVLGAAWLLLGAGAMRAYLRAVDEARDPLPSLLPAALTLHGVAALALPYSSNDLFSNLAYGRMARLGLDPYASGPGALPPGDAFRALVSPNWIDTPSVYGPILTWLDALAGRGASVPAAMAIFKLALLAVTWVTVLVAWDTCRCHLPAARAASAFVLLGWNPLLAWEMAGQAHNDGVMLLGLTAFVWAALGGRRLLAVLFLSLAFYAKFAVAPVLGLYLVYVARQDRLRALLGAGIFAALGVLLFLPFWSGPATLLGPLAAVRANPVRVTRSFTEVASLLAGLWSPAAAAWAYRVGWTLGMALLLALAVRAVRRARSVEAVLHESLLYLLSYLLLASPFVLPWYVGWLLPLAFVDPDARWRRVVAVYSSLSLVAWCADLPPLQAAVVNTWVLVLVARIGRGPSPSERPLLGPPAAAA
jgi:alpha-1,6-mannosyltransferase